MPPSARATIALTTAVLAALLAAPAAAQQPPIPSPRPPNPATTVRSWPIAIIARGALDRHLINRFYLRRYASDVNACYATHVRTRADHDTIHLHFALGDRAPYVHHVVAVTNTTGSAAFRTCVLEKATAWHFPGGPICGIALLDLTLRVERRDSSPP